jgi:hypothetical protein
MRTVRWCIAAATLLLAMTPALVMASQTVGVQLTPSTASPGATVYVRALCASGSSAMVSSAAFATASMGPATSGGGLIALVTVAASTRPGSYGVHVSCGNGDTGDASLTVAPAGGAGTGDGTMAGGPSLPLVGAGLFMISAAACILLLLVRRRAGA